MEIEAPANIIFQAAAPSPAFLSIVTPTVNVRFDGLVSVNTRGRIYSFQPPLNDSNATVASIGRRTGKIIL